jgi:methionyl-tRNA synthetase
LLNPTELINPVCQRCKVTTPKKVMSPHVFLDLPKVQHELEEWVNKSSVEGKWTYNSIKTTYFLKKFQKLKFLIFGKIILNF